ncbi:MAG: response regulator [Chloroflexi bacterium]|nr:response regulator [Chloroflexota bacterium]
MSTPVKKVLLADDEEDVLILLSATIGKNDQYQLLFARNGEEALALARREKPDVVLLDVMMAKKDGFEVCRALKRDPQTAKTRVVILTALSQDADKRKGFEAGADHYFTKPFSPTALLDKLYELLGMD